MPGKLGIGGVALGDARDEVRRTLDDGTVTSEDADRVVVSAGSRTVVFVFGADGRLFGIGSAHAACC